jgi:hypothetical protein
LIAGTAAAGAERHEHVAFKSHHGCSVVIQIETEIAIEIERICQSVQEKPSAYGFDFEPDYLFGALL